MQFIKDPDFYIKFETSSAGKMIHVMVYDRSTKQTVRLGHVQGRQHFNKANEWVSSPPDKYIAEKVRNMIHQVLKDIQDLT